MATLQLVGLLYLLANLRAPAAEPLVVNMPAPPPLTGPLAPNTKLAEAVKFAENVIEGPESMVISNGYVYTGLGDGYVVEVRPNGSRRNIRRMSLNSCGRPNAGESACGRPLGVREHRGYLIVADAYHGIISLNPVSGDFRILVSGNTVVNGKRIGGFINDLVIARDGSIYFTVSSSKYTREDYLKSILEAETSGRVLVYNARFPGRQKVRELVTTLNFPNGIQLSKNEDYLLIAEGARSRIHKAYIDRRKPNFGRIETFASNLPGFVDNIRPSPRGTYWVGLSRARFAGQPSVLDRYGSNPRIRAALMNLPKEQVLAQAPKYGMVVELNDKGQIIRSLHDPKGVLFPAGVSEVQEDNGILYLGSFNSKFVGKLSVKDLPPITTPPNPSNELEAFLNQIKERLSGMGPNEVQRVVLSLVQYLVQVKLDAMKTEARLREAEAEIKRLNDVVNSMSTTTAPATTTTASATTTTAASGTTSTASATTSTVSGTTQPPTTTAAVTTSAPTTTATPAPTTTTNNAPTTTTQAGQTTTAAAATTTSGAVTTSTASGVTTSTAAATTSTVADDSTTTSAAVTTSTAAATTTNGDVTTSTAAETTTGPQP